MTDIVHENLPCGIEYGVVHLPQRHVAAFQFRMLAGACTDPDDKLGLARLVTETLDKGTQRRSGRELWDAFDAIGASYHNGTGRESVTMTCTVLPEHFEHAVALYAEMLRTPTFPEDSFSVNVDLARQELIALQDDPQGLVDKLIGVPAYGPLLGRHPLGENETLDNISRDDLSAHWSRLFRAGRMLVAVAGPIDPDTVRDVLQGQFSGFGSEGQKGRDGFKAEFHAGTTHHDKDLEQEHIGICWPGVQATHDDFPVQQVMVGILAGGMSGRLFTEVREKQGLVYWVNAWHETPRGSGRVFLGASTTPDRCEKTYSTLLREVNRLAEGIEQDELERAITGIVASKETRGDSTRSRCSELASDLFFYGRPIPSEEKVAKVQAVTVDDICRYLSTYPRDKLCVMTLGPRPLTGSAEPLTEQAAGE
ncbi:MAG: insulinase family protein [Phycisphaerales bacterium]|nr:MAG: insulinase family protein [Phycisphaerales bacterium]